MIHNNLVIIHVLTLCACVRVMVINPWPEGYGSRFVVHSVHRATENSVHFFAPVKV